MPSDRDTIVALKSVFLRSQIRVLSQPLQIPEQWAESSEFSSAVLHDVINEVNRQLRRHNNEVYFPLAVRNVAQQIDQLYWDASSTSQSSSAHHDPYDDSIIYESDDLTSDAVIALLPESWDNSPEYIEQRNKLKRLSERRKELGKKLAQLRELQQLLEPFKEGVQGSLVTKDGPLQKELEKSRMLSTRVAVRVAGLKSGEGDGEEQENVGNADEMETCWDQNARLKRILDMT